MPVMFLQLVLMFMHLNEQRNDHDKNAGTKTKRNANETSRFTRTNELLLQPSFQPNKNHAKDNIYTQNFLSELWKHQAHCAFGSEIHRYCSGWLRESPILQWFCSLWQTWDEPCNTWVFLLCHLLLLLWLADSPIVTWKCSTAFSKVCVWVCVCVWSCACMCLKKNLFESDYPPINMMKS